VRDGIERQLDPGAPVIGNAFAEERPPVLPLSLSAAATEFRSSPFTVNAFGSEVVEHFGAHADYEWSEFMKVVTDWERERYFEDA
jgi:glutamine synthetase